MDIFKPGFPIRIRQKKTPYSVNNGEKKNTIQTIMSFRSFNTVLESVEYSALLDLTRFEKIKTLILTAKGNGLQNKR